MSDNITIITPNGFRYLRSEEGIWAIQSRENGLEVITDPGIVAEDFEQLLNIPYLIKGNERSLILALVAELKMNAGLYSAYNKFKMENELLKEEARSFSRSRRDL